MSKRRRVTALLAAGAFAVLLAGCGGGGGGAHPSPTPTPTPSPTPSPTPTPTPSGFNDAEYQASNSAVTANALPAYQASANGQNVKVAVIDTGINPNITEFAGRIDPSSQDVAASRGIVDHQGHGSMVSGVIAANRNGSYMQGVAWGASIISLNVYDPAGCKPGNDCFLDSAIDDAIDLARINGARIINMSFGDEEGMTADVWPAIQRAVDAGIVIIMAAGNGGTANPNGFALQNIANNGSSGLFIIAGAMNSSRTMASFSDRAGSTAAASWYLTALGVGNATVNQFGQHVNVNGTSFATPTIAGAAALLAGAFPNLSGAEIVELLLTTADDAGAAGTDVMFGRGILNIGRAFEPQGATSLAGSGKAFALAGSGSSSGPIGDAASRRSGAGAIILDGYSRAFAVDLARTLSRQSQEQPLRLGLAGHGIDTRAQSAGPVSVSLTVRRNRMGEQRADVGHMRLDIEQADRAQAIAGLAVTRLSRETAVALGISQSARSLQQRLAGQAGRAFLVAHDPLSRAGFQADPGAGIALRQQLGAFGLTAASERGRQWRTRGDTMAERPAYAIHSLTLDGRSGPAAFSLGWSLLEEDRTMLGSRFDPVFLSGGSRTAFLDAGVELALGGGWDFAANARHGWTRVSGSGELVDAGRLGTRAFAFDLAKTGMVSAGDRLAFRFAQPLRVVHGGFGLTIPVAWDYATESATFGKSFMSLSPVGRELDYEVAYGRALWGGTLDLNAFVRTDPGHVEAMRTDAGGAIRFTLRR